MHAPYLRGTDNVGTEAPQMTLEVVPRAWPREHVLLPKVWSREMMFRFSL